ncbi:MAG: hypothetical protein JWM21_4522 [Acidobacteria bacterium]|nr:hypothetical protein [Acidobacteriota bacterium]
MSVPQSIDESAAGNQPPLRRDSQGRVDVDSVPDVIQWFLDYDQRVAIVKHARVEEVFQWKQSQSRLAGEEVFLFNRAEDRLAIGIIQALSENATESGLHSWIAQLLNALDSASRTNETISEAYGLDLAGSASTVNEAAKIPAARERAEFLFNCWIETLCSAEARVLGWLYKEFYGRPFAP